MEIQIRKLLEKDKIDSDELIAYLQDGYTSSYDFETFTLSVSNDFDFIFYKLNHKKYPSHLKCIRYTKNDLSKDEFKAKINDAISFLKQTIINVSSQCLFTHIESQIYYEYKDCIQIIRAPDDCQKPKTQFGDFPLLVKFKYEGSNNNVIKI